MKYKQFDFRKRCQIYGLWRAGYNQSQIAKEVGVHKSTISREINRNITFVPTELGSLGSTSQIMLKGIQTIAIK